MSIFFPLTHRPLKKNPLMSLVMQPDNHVIGPKQTQMLTNKPKRAIFPVFYLIYCPLNTPKPTSWLSGNTA